MVDSNVNGQQWQVRITDNGTSIFRGDRTTVAASGSFEVVFLLADGVAVGTAAARVHPPRAASLAIRAANVAWAAASLGALLTGALSPTLIGGLWIGAQAVVVGGFAAAQNWALRRLPSMS